MTQRFWTGAVLTVCNVLIISYLAHDFVRESRAVSAQAPIAKNLPQYADAQLQILTHTINNARSDAGLAVLEQDSELDRIAEERAQDMANKAYYAHKSPDGLYFSDLLDVKEYPYDFACENLNMAETPDPKVFFMSWLASEGHKKCMLNSSVTKVGYATTKVLISNGIPVSQHIVVAIYANDDK